MLEYKTVTSEYTNDFDKDCNRLIQQGWRPQGGVSILVYDSRPGNLIKAQAFVRESDN